MFQLREFELFEREDLNLNSSSPEEERRRGSEIHVCGRFSEISTISRRNLPCAILSGALASKQDYPFLSRYNVTIKPHLLLTYHSTSRAREKVLSPSLGLSLFSWEE
jgi:hypothetical protein